ncbi:Inner membrane protein YbiR [Halomonas sp. 59]|nr:Inner membrane protein YbiR [Halomonas sp. 59]CAD5246213.1 Inner membrane protein YbiR [Halomonas sp. 113]CAD5253431.1 Inner membrane protein YbiR [Halomonas sp. 156]CAD5290522.1 Inner membrane protein YbiR [Halomonas sp. I3]VXB90079.1 Inner membrane protein YbiR [Halomonas titanicae]
MLATKWLVTPFSLFFQRFLNDPMLLSMSILWVVLCWLEPQSLSEMADRVHWTTLVVLTGLMLLSRALELSGYLTLWGRQLLALLRGERRLAVGLILFSGLLSAIVTNDVALFIVVPLTLSLAGMATLPIERLIVFEALAVNAGSSLSPIGNPQNLYLWQLSGIRFGDFLWVMLPLGVGLMLSLLLFVPLAFPKASIHLEAVSAMTAERRKAPLWAALIGYPLFLVAVDMGWVLSALAGVLLSMLWVARRAVFSIDWLLLIVFVLMFVNLSVIGELSIVQQFIHSMRQWPGGDVSAGVLLSQVVSNVPATLLLAQQSEWQPLAWGVSVGGFGLAIGSMANLIALRLARQPGIWKEFHCWSLPMLGLGWLFAAVWLSALTW